MATDNGRSPLRGSGSQASPGAADASPPSVSIPNARDIRRGIDRLRAIRYVGPARAIEQMIAVSEEMERALRIRIWNECKQSGMGDAPAYARIKALIAAIYASGIEAAEPDRPRSGLDPEGESPAPKGGAQPQPESSK